MKKKIDKIKKFLKIKILILPIFIIIIIFIIAPWIISLINSFRVRSELDIEYYDITIKNYYDVIGNVYFKKSFYNSNFLAIVIMPISFSLSMSFAFLLHSITSKRFKSFISTSLFSQFFISAYAIGISFTFLFNIDKNIINKIFGTSIPFLTDFSGFYSLLTLSIFLSWRLFSFNVVLIFFALSKISNQKINMVKLDKLNIINRWIHLYYPSLRKTLILVLYVNFFESLFLLPDSIFESQASIDLYGGNTLSNFLFALKEVDKTESTYAASTIILLWTIFLILSFYFSVKIVKIINLQLQKRRLYGFEF